MIAHVPCVVSTASRGRTGTAITGQRIFVQPLPIIQRLLGLCLNRIPQDLGCGYIVSTHLGIFAP